MSISLRWGNSEKTILTAVFEPNWNWDDLWSMDNQYKELADSIPHVFSLIIDVSEARAPSIFIPQLGQIANLSKNRPQNLDFTVVVGSTGLLGNAAEIFTKVYKNQSKNVFFASTVDHALTFIFDRRAKHNYLQQRPLGRTGHVVSVIGLGLAALGRPGYINLGHGYDLNHEYKRAIMESNAHQVIEAAWEAGVQYFDAARSYGDAEAFLSSWMKKLPAVPNDMVIGSKWGYRYTANWEVDAKKHEVKEHSLANLRHQTGESLANFGKHLTLYQIHSATIESGVLENQSVLDELAILRNEGLLIGLSTSGPNQSETIFKALEVLYDGVPLFSTVQSTWNLLEQSTTNALYAAYQSGMGIIIKEALANGRLTHRNTNPKFNKKRQLLKAIASEQNCTIDALALASVIAQPWVSIVLSGAATVEHLQSNLKAVNVLWNDDLNNRLSPLIESPPLYWKTRSQLAWN
ncbi:MAG: aldo/keto reductase [Chloroflexota bacterium]